MTSMHHFYTLFSNFWWNFLQNIMFKNNMVSTGFSKIDYPIITHYPLIPNSKSLLNKIGRIFPKCHHPQKGLRNQMGVFQNVINPKKVCGIKCCFSKCDHPQKVCLTIITNGHQSSPSTRVTYRLVKVRLATHQNGVCAKQAHPFLPC